ncbi:MAG: hypothetical protein EOO27_22300 [Comamonadaceae bacterium]|nr:MAG: hypothetical protein EOO27_22300 [Comamonadaceae bacterium]
MKTHFSAALRFYVCASVGCTAAIAGWDPYSQHRFAMSEDGFGGLIAICLLGVLALLGILDVFINDILPERYSLRWTHRHRHVVFMLLAIGQIALILALVKINGLRPSAGRYAIDAAMSTWIAVVGVMHHFRIDRAERLERVSQRADL